MLEMKCFDSYGNAIDHYTQWDVDQDIVMVLDGCDNRYLAIPPEIHFANGKSKEAIVVESKIIDDCVIGANVPNEILAQEYPFWIYIYAIDKDDTSSKKTIASIQMQMVKRACPDDYYE